MAPPGHAFENQRRAIGQDDDGGGDPGDPVVPETLRIVLVAGLGEGIAVGRGDHCSRLRAGRAGGGGEQVDPGGRSSLVVRSGRARRVRLAVTAAMPTSNEDQRR